MSIKDVFGPTVAAGAWEYNPSTTYLVGMGAGTQYSAAGAYNVRLYSPDDDSWSNDMETAFGTTGVNTATWQCVVDKKLYVCNPYGSQTKFSCYDPSTNNWTVLPNPPLAMFVEIHAVWDGATGIFSVESNGSFRHYETTTGVWSVKANVPSCSAYGSALDRIGQTIYCFDNTTVHSYDIATNVWTPNVSATPVGMNFGKGGTASDGVGPIYWWKDWMWRSFDGAVWTVLANAPLPSAVTASFKYPTGAVLNGKVYMPQTRGASTTGYAEISVYDIASDTWSPTKAYQTGYSFGQGILVL